MRLTHGVFVVVLTTAPAAAQYPWLSYSDPALPGTGAAVCNAGDVNGDGVADLVVGSCDLDLSSGQYTPISGRVTWLSGLDGSVLHFAQSAVPDGLGASLDVVGDWNGDGRPEIAAGAPWVSTTYPQIGEVRILDGASGATLSTFTLPNAIGLGSSVVGLGDLDGDGIGDFASSNDQAAFVVSGASNAILLTIPAPAGAGLGGRLGRYGDLDSDGLDDLLIGYPTYNAGQDGQVRLVSSATGATLRTFLAPTPDSSFGMQLDTVGDLDGDGRTDVIVGSPQILHSPGGPGYVAIYSSTGALLRQVFGAQAVAYFGADVAGGGDVDGDQVADYAIAKTCKTSAPGCVREAIVYSGASGQVLFSLESSNVGSFGAALEFVGDLTGDGRSEFAFGSPCSDYFQHCGDLRVVVPGTFGPTVPFCQSGTTSNGCAASMSSSGVPSASATFGFTLHVGGVEGQRSGLVFYGVAGRASVAWGASTSYLCVKPPTQRTPLQSSGGTFGTCTGSFALDWWAFQTNHPNALGAPFAAGDVIEAQAWFRDPPNPKSTALSNALEIVLLP